MTTQHINNNAPNAQEPTPQNPIATAHVEELMGNVPSWILRWGITVVLFIVMAFITASWLMSYSDVVKIQVELTTQKPPIPIVALTNGKISQLLVANKQTVDSGRLLAILDNTARFQDVDSLEKWLKESALEEFSEEKKGALSMAPPLGLQVGVLQNTYTSLLQLYADFQYVTTENGVSNKVAKLSQQISTSGKSKDNVRRQKRAYESELRTAQDEYNRYMKLEKRFRSDAEQNKLQNEIARAQGQLARIDAESIGSDKEKQQLEVQILELKTAKTNAQTDKELNLTKVLQTLGSEIQKWKQDYLLIAPISGQVSLSKIWSPQQYVKMEEEVMTIVPNRSIGDKNPIICRGLLPHGSESGKVKPQQKVNIRVDGYNYHQFGVLTATVVHIADAPTKEGYPIEIELDGGNKSTTNILKTNAQKDIYFRQGQIGIAHIVTEKRSFLSRIFDNFKGITSFN